MLNRALQVKMVKMNDLETENGSLENTPSEVATVISYTVDRIGQKILFGICAYVVLDTVRQVVVEKARVGSQK